MKAFWKIDFVRKKLLKHKYSVHINNVFKTQPLWYHNFFSSINVFWYCKLCLQITISRDRIIENIHSCTYPLTCLLYPNVDPLKIKIIKFILRPKLNLFRFVPDERNYFAIFCLFAFFVYDEIFIFKLNFFKHHWGKMTSMYVHICVA